MGIRVVVAAFALVSAVPTLAALVASAAGSRMVASRNVIVDNASFAFLNGGGTFESSGDSVLRNNNCAGPQPNGTITTFSPQ